MDRAEHLAWCKKRAFEYLDVGDWKQAHASFLSDMGKHEETRNHLALTLGVMRVMNGQINNTEEMRKWIEGFN